MMWLFENPLGTMPGPAFLGLFGGVLVGAILVLRTMAGKLERGEDPSRMSIPREIDPFQIAYLRGGDTEVARAAMVDLVEKKRLVETPKSGLGKWISGGGNQWQVADPMDTGSDLPAVQRLILRSFSTPTQPNRVFESETLAQVRSQTAPYKEWMERENLQVDSEATTTMRKLMILSLVGIEFLGAYKLASAYLHGHHNVLFLIGLMLFTMIIVPICSRHRRLTQRGADFLKDMQTAFAPLVSVKDFEARPSRPDLALGNCSIPVMAMGIFGISALQGSSLDPMYLAYRKAAANSSGCSGCSSGFGSTSGCGSGSSCGSGCGGGCGGCGGGGD